MLFLSFTPAHPMRAAGFLRATRRDHRSAVNIAKAGLFSARAVLRHKLTVTLQRTAISNVESDAFN
ncbi:hypothetical protein BG454_12550 [Roseinatronobacter bogoriensis subsp. barguzinensis]|uniref:Uncharacterized protein n=1 Tax=Roseinatronobacter bogoriensis subsp. barguzinensis TaxID=441209 RepID=A0A2K8KJR6_9RHOB|nr:hypothetical protein BG454_12550 [Rhodobaca barguzinensis]